MLLAFLFAAAIDAGSSQPATASAPAETRPKARSEMVCRNEEVTGSHFKHRVCVTREEAEAATERDRRQVDRLQQTRTDRPAGLGPGS